MKKLLLLFVLFAIGSGSFAQNTYNLIDKVTISTNEIGMNMGFRGFTYGGTVYEVNSEGYKLDSSWHYIALTIDANKDQRLYIDGEMVHWFNTDQDHIYNKTYLGANMTDPSNPNAFFYGVVDEVRISNKVRTQEEITNVFNSNTPFVNDGNTIELFRFNYSSTGENGTSYSISYGSPKFVDSKFSQGLKFDGTQDVVNLNIDPPETNVSFELWAKVLETTEKNFVIIQPMGAYNGGVWGIIQEKVVPLEWSTGETAVSITIDPKDCELVWVTDGNDTDTLVMGDSYKRISVTDTLIIDAYLTGIEPPDNKNTIKIYPNPAKTHIFINTGDYDLMNGYQIRIDNSLGQTVFSNNINQQEFYINLSDWTGPGLYLVYIIDTNSNVIEVKKIIIQ
jgi:hypothetical protein